MFIDRLGQIRSIRLEQVAGGVRAIVMRRIKWRGFLGSVVWCTLIAILGWQFVFRRVALPCLIAWSPFRSIWAELAGIFLLVFAILGLVTLFDGTLEHGTIESDGEAICVNLRGLWGRQRTFRKEDVRAVRAVCGAFSKAEGRGGPPRPSMMLQIIPWEGEAVKLLSGRSGRDLTALASALTGALGISREQRRQEWLKRHLENNAASAQSTMLEYGAEVRGSTLEVAPQRVVLSLPPHGLLAKAALFKIEEGLFSCLSGELTRGWGIDQIHWIGPIDDELAFSALAVVLDDGTVERLSRFRTVGELRYAARVLNSALGLTSGEQT